MCATKDSFRVIIFEGKSGKTLIREVHDCLIQEGFDVTLDSKFISMGMHWPTKIIMRNYDSIIICLSNNSLEKNGRSDIQYVLELAMSEQPDVIIIPVRLEVCNIPSELAQYQWIDLFSVDGYEKLLKALRPHANNDII